MTGPKFWVAPNPKQNPNPKWEVGKVNLISGKLKSFAVLFFFCFVSFYFGCRKTRGNINIDDDKWLGKLVWKVGEHRKLKKKGIIHNLKEARRRGKRKFGK